MCRIFGHLGSTKISDVHLNNVSKKQYNGGPDKQTFLIHKDWSLGNNRLAIQGIDGGLQPFTLNGLTCVFNGEIYNHREIRKSLIKRGYSFTDECDGNIIIPLYQCFGDNYVKKLEGMFAIAIIDQSNGKNSLKIFNDYSGMKSVYFYCEPNYTSLFFASELEALFEFPGIPKDIRAEAIDQFFGGKAVWGPNTIYKNIHTLSPGCILQFEPGSAPKTVRYELDFPGSASERSQEEIAFELHSLLSHETELMLAADVPVCVITSGGLDSSYITSIASKITSNLHSFNISYKGDWPQDERKYARTVANYCATKHHQVELDPKSFPAYIDQFVASIDQPNTAPHCLSTFALFEAIHDAGFKVALTGDGADELFCGYKRFITGSENKTDNWHQLYQQTMAVGNSTFLKKLYSNCMREIIFDKYFVDQIGAELNKQVQGGNSSKVQTLLEFDQRKRFPYYILRRVDHLSMAHSVEARMPFLQPSIIKLANSLSPQQLYSEMVGKIPLVNAAMGSLPNSIIGRKKQAFTLPVIAMIKKGEELYDYIADTLFSSNTAVMSLFERKFIAELFVQHEKSPQSITANTLWSLMIMERWMKHRNLSV